MPPIPYLIFNRRRRPVLYRAVRRTGPAQRRRDLDGHRVDVECGQYQPGRVLAYTSRDPVGTQTGIVFRTICDCAGRRGAAIGLALIIAIYRSRDTVNVEEINLLKW